MLKAIDTRNYKWVSNLSDEERKSISPWVLMRFVSACNSNNDDIRDHYLIMVNEIINLDFNTLSKHPELQFRMMQLIGLGTPQYHPWIAPGKRQKKDKIGEWLMRSYPSCNDDEIGILRQQSKAELKELAGDQGLTDKEIKDLFK